MKKKALFMVVLGGLCLAGCSHEHMWTEATCGTVKTCIDCGETEGEELEHLFAKASCTKPETCSRCGETRGEVLEHDYLIATCSQAELCSRCGAERGERAAHTEQFIGVCERCHEIQNKEVVEDIFSKLEEANIYLSIQKGSVSVAAIGKTSMLQGSIPWGLLAEDDVTTVKGIAVWGDAQLRKVYSKSVVAGFEAICSLYEEARAMCEGYEGLETLQARLSTVVEFAPVDVPEFKEEEFVQYDILASQCNQAIFDEVLAKFKALWGPYIEKETLFYETIAPYWNEAVRVAEIVGMKANENWWE